MNCCTELGFDEYGNLRVAKSSDLEATFRFPEGYDFDGYSGIFQIRASADSDPALLEVTATATAAGSVLVYSGRTILIRLKVDDLSTLPENADDANEPWVGVFEWRNNDTANLDTRFLAGAIVAERGVVR